MPLSQTLVRLDGLYGNLTTLSDLLGSGLAVIVRCKDYALLDLPAVSAKLALAPDQQVTHPESQVSRSLFDCPDLALLPGGPRLRLIIATRPATSSKPPIGIQREGSIYELFLCNAPQTAFTCSDLLELYLHRGSFETTLFDEDVEQDPDRWCSRTHWGQECWQIVSQWIWNWREHLGQHLAEASMRLTIFAPGSGEIPSTEELAHAAEPTDIEQATPLAAPVIYGPPQWAHRSWTKGFAGCDFVPQPHDTLLCPAGHPLRLHERRPERNGSVRLVYGARIIHCRPCPLRTQCLESEQTRKPRQVSAVLWPLASSASLPAPTPPFSLAHPILWGDWPRRELRRRWMQVLRTQTVSLHPLPPPDPILPGPDLLFTRKMRAHWRLSWQERFSRNARSSGAMPLTITIYGLPASMAQFIGLPLMATA